VDLVRSVLPSAYAAKARGVVLCAIAVSATYFYYLAVDADDVLPPAAADSIPAPPVVRMASLGSPMHVISDAEAHEGPAEPALDRVRVARDLQTALSMAHCYDGPISGKWTAASRAAMGAFLGSVNAQLPVSDPDPALLALVESNPSATCSRKSALVADALGAPSPRSGIAHEQRLAIATDVPTTTFSSGEEPRSPVDGRSMLDHPWAQPEMLVPSSDMKAAASEVTAPIAQENAIPREPPVMKVSAAGMRDSALHFEGGSVIADTGTRRASETAAATAAAASASPAPVAAPSKVTQQRKAKPTKRRARRNDDAPFGVSFDSLQRSVSSWFD
jgi:hypothetical protein